MATENTLKLEKPMAVTIEEAGRLLGISRSLAYELANTGEIPTIRIGKKRRLVAIESLEKLLRGEAM